MIAVVLQNVVGRWRGPPVALDRRRRRLSTIASRFVPRGRKALISLHRRGSPWWPTDDTYCPRKHWRRTLVGPDSTVLITILPLGGGGGGNRAGKTALSIGLALASIALIAFAGPLGAFLAGSAATATAFTIGSAVVTFGQLAQVGLVIGGVALSIAAQRLLAAKKDKSGGEVYSVSGGGNLPRPGDRKPLIYGRCVTQPPLSQPDLPHYYGDNMTLTKRLTLGIGKFQVHKVFVGEAVFWSEAGGIRPPFDVAQASLPPPFDTMAGAEPVIEFLYNSVSTFLPGDISASPEVSGQAVPNNNGNPEWTPRYRVCPLGLTTPAIQLNFQFPQGIYFVRNSGQQEELNAHILFEAQQIDELGDIVGAPFTLLDYFSGNMLKTKPIRESKIINLADLGKPRANYTVRARNLYEDADNVYSNATWDGLFALNDNTRARPNTTEIAIKVFAGKGLPITAFSDIWVDATRIVPVWNGTAWVEQPERRAVWSHADLVRSDYGFNDSDGLDLVSHVDISDRVTTNNTFDGPLPTVSSVWEAASIVLLPLRAQPVRLGRLHSLVRDEPVARPRHIISRRQTVRGSAQVNFQFATEDGAGDLIVEFDRGGDPRQTDYTPRNPVGGVVSRTPKRMKVPGVSTSAHARSLQAWIASAAVYRGADESVTTEWDGRLIVPGDHILADVHFLEGKMAFGVATIVGNVLTLDVDASLPTAWAYAAIRTRRGKEWGILKARGQGVRGLELDAGELAALEASSGLALADVLASDTQDPTTLVYGELIELQETYIARSALLTDADHVRIEMVRDDPRVWDFVAAAEAA